jgi:cysteinyl-tRNA synthetase
MALQVLDHVTRTKRPFAPVRPGRVGMYVCGLTVQDRPHLGHMYAFVACDMVRRYLEHLGYAVTLVQNFTDIDDKIIERARREGVAPETVARRNMERYHEAAAALQIEPAQHYPLVTEHIADIVAFIERLVEAGHAYQAGGDVYFQVRSWPAYGTLSGRDLDEMRSGIRVPVGDAKRDPLDFALWKESGSREPGWDSPWGRGRPGWHIECSAMAVRYLGEHFDFHGGGRDLLFPHHENELAQSCCATGQPYVNHWLHNGLLYLGKRKMSKSDGNFLDMDGLLARHQPAVLRFFLLNAHFRSQLEFGEERLREAASGYGRLERGARQVLAILADLEDGCERPVPTGLISGPGLRLLDAAAVRRRRFFASMDDDFNSGAAIGELFGLVRDLNLYLAATEGHGLDPEPIGAVRDLLAEADGLLAIFPGGMKSLSENDLRAPTEVLALCRQRHEVRRRGDWDEADGLRERILDLGWVVMDTAQGYRVVRATDRT